MKRLRLFKEVKIADFNADLKQGPVTKKKSVVIQNKMTDWFK